MNRILPLSALFASAVAFGLAGTTRAVDYPNNPGPDPKPAVTTESWKVETVLRAPQIESPSVVCALPDGRVLVAEDPLDNRGGKEPIDRILCLFPDGHITVWADHLNPVFGLQYLDGKVYVHQYPILSVFTDDNGVAKDRKDLIDHTGQSTIGGLNDHIPAALRYAMDGYFYLANGDRGIYGAKSNVDGTEADIRGGGLTRIRPDGTGLEVYSTGTRNHLDVSMNAEDEKFTYDNTDDGHGWWTRFTHMVDGGTYGYPWDYKPVENHNDPKSQQTVIRSDPDAPYKPYTLWRAAEYGGGSPCGAVGYNEDALPPEYRGNLFHCEWGKGKVQRFVVERDGGTFKVAKMEDFLKPGGDMRPLGICVTEDGSGFWVTDWGYGGWHQKKPDVGRLLKVTYTGKSLATPKPTWYVPAAMGKKFDATTADLVAALAHPAESVRLVASRRLAERGTEAVAPLVALVGDANAPPHARWHAIWTLDKLQDGKAGRDAILAVLKDNKADVSVRRQAARQLGTRRAAEATDTLVAALSDADASIRFQVATALGRVGNAAAVPAILGKLDEKDLFTRFALFTALNRIGRADAKAWPAIVRGIESASAAARDNTTYALRDTYDTELVSALVQESFDKSKPGEVRARALLSAAELHRKVKPWEGKWWGTQPVGQPRPAKDLDWPGTSTILNAIRDLAKDSDPKVQAAAIGAMSVAPDPAAADVLVELFKQNPDVSLRTMALQALAAGNSPKGEAIAVALLKDPKADAALIRPAIEVIRAGGTQSSGEALLALVKAGGSPDVLAPAIEALGAIKVGASEVGKHVSDSDPRVWNAAVSALVQMKSKESIESLTNALTDKRPEVRGAAATSLGNLHAKQAVPGLIRAASDPATKSQIVQALCKIPSTEALDIYLDALSGQGGNDKNAAKAAIKAIAREARPLVDARLDKGTISPDALAALQEIYGEVQPLTVWSIAGSFPADKPDVINLAALTGATPIKGPDGKDIPWKKITTRAEHGMVDLGNLLGASNDVYAILVAEFTANGEREVDFLFGSDDNHVVYLNGQKIHEDTADGGWAYDEAHVKGKVKAGKNVLVARCGNSGGGWQFSAAVGGERKGKLYEMAATGAKPNRDAYAAFALANAGNAENGAKIFRGQNTGCIKCHQVGNEGGLVGPSLMGVGAKYDRAKLVESVIYPSKQIFDGYEQTLVQTKDGDVFSGVVKEDTEKQIVLFDSAAQRIVVSKADVKTRKKSELSVMPEGLEQGMTTQEFADLIGYLEHLKEVPAGTPAPKTK